MLSPSLVLAVRDRRRTTALLVETAWMVACVSAVLSMGAVGQLPVLETTLAMHMCTMHVFYQQGVELRRARRLLVAEDLFAILATLCSLALPVIMTMNTPGAIPDTHTAVLTLFSGEICGTASAWAASIVLAAANTYERALAHGH